MNDHVLIWIVVLTFAFTIHGTAKPKNLVGYLEDGGLQDGRHSTPGDG